VLVEVLELVVLEDQEEELVIFPVMQAEPAYRVKELPEVMAVHLPVVVARVVANIMYGRIMALDMPEVVEVGL
jgi:hypothetical protein